MHMHIRPTPLHTAALPPAPAAPDSPRTVYGEVLIRACDLAIGDVMLRQSGGWATVLDVVAADTEPYVVYERYGKDSDMGRLAYTYLDRQRPSWILVRVDRPSDSNGAEAADVVCPVQSNGLVTVQAPIAVQGG